VKADYIARLLTTIQHLHNCAAVWRETVPVHEVFGGKTVWHGDVECFDLTGHPKAQKCYAWSYGEPEEIITILELPPVRTAQDAVKVGVSYQIKKSKEKK
jgi:hypothetical protein